jgi:threonine aldolase
LATVYQMFMKSFASDNYAGVLPEIMEALQKANNGHERSYGSDTITARTLKLFKEVFDSDVDVFFVFNGTGANVLCISSTTQSFNSVIVADTSHIYNDEGSAPETFSGCRFFPVAANDDGKLEPAAVAQRLIRAGDVHYAQPSLLSITQATEYGTVYSVDEIKALARLAHQNDMYLHIDGSRFFNAAAGLGCELREMSTYADADILSLGGTKAGMMFGEAVVVFNKTLARHIAFKHKQVMQLASKTRYIAAQFEAMLTEGLWRTKAVHANNMAKLLHAKLSVIPQVKITKPVQANAVFAEIPRHWYESLQAHFPFYVWKESTHEVRLMCAWDTTVDDVSSLAGAIQKLV